MFRVLFFLLLVLALGYGFALLADTPGDVVVTVAGQEISFSLMVAAVALAAAIVAVMFTWWLVRVVFTSPQRMNRFFRSRRRDRGYQALSTGIIAAGAGDPSTAHKMLKRADGLLVSSSEPLLKLLDAQAVMLEGKHDDARSKFEAMLDDPELRDLGLRGLYMEAQRLGDREAQKHYAEKAAELAPQLAWASKAALDMKTSSRDWDGALRLVDQQTNAKQIDRDAGKRKRAVLLTAIAQDNVEANPTRAKQAGLEAHRLAQDFAPAAVAASAACLRLNELRRAAKVLETTWRKAPHPEVALAYANVRPGDSAQDRLKKARKLEQLKPNNTESSLIVAQMALEAGEFEDARKAVAAVLRNEPRESAYMLMADIEDTETGDQGKVREWLSRAVRAPRDPAWTADGYVAESWAPFSPVSGRIDAFEWRVPVERIGGSMIENDLDPMQPGIAPLPMPEPMPEPEPTPTPEPEPRPEPVKDVAAEPEPEAEAKPELDKESASAAIAAGAMAAVTTTAVASSETVVEAASDVKDAASEVASGAAETVQDAASEAVAALSEATETGEADAPKPVDDAAQPPKANSAAAEGSQEKDAAETEVISPPIPDDPGVEPEDGAPAEKPKRFRLF